MKTPKPPGPGRPALPPKARAQRRTLRLTDDTMRGIARLRARWGIASDAKVLTRLVQDAQAPFRAAAGR